MGSVMTQFNILHSLPKTYFKIRGCIQKFPDWVDDEIYAYLWYCSL